jgi:hypothetical protein
MMPARRRRPRPLPAFALSTWGNHCLPLL